MLWHQRLSTKLAATILIIIGILIVSAGLLFTFVMDRQYRSGAELENRARAALLRDELVTIDSMMREQAISAMRVLKDRSSTLGPPSLGKTVTVGEKQVADIMFGNSGQANDFALVDKVKELMGGTATLFVKNGEDFVRVSTNVQKTDGARAVGTVLDPKGKAIEAIRRKSPFYGTVKILDKPYITLYEPIVASSGEVIGVYYVGYALDAFIGQIEKKIGRSKTLETGTYALIDDAGAIVHQSDRAPKDLLEQALEGKSSIEAPGWHFAEERFDAWQYRAVAFYAESDPGLTRPIANARILILAGSLVLLGLLGALIVFLTRRFMKPLDTALAVASDLSLGRIDGREKIEIESKDEIGRMLRAMKEVSDYFRSVAAAAEALRERELSVAVNARSADDLLSSRPRGQFAMLGKR